MLHPTSESTPAGNEPLSTRGRAAPYPADRPPGPRARGRRTRHQPSAHLQITRSGRFSWGIMMDVCRVGAGVGHVQEARSTYLALSTRQGPPYQCHSSRLCFSDFWQGANLPQSLGILRLMTNDSQRRKKCQPAGLFASRLFEQDIGMLKGYIQ